MSEPFDLIYNAITDKAISSLDRLIAKVREFEAATEKSKASWASFIAMQGVAQAVSEVGRLGSALGTLDSTADKAAAAIGTVGQNTGAIASATTKADALTTQLAATEAQALKTGAAVGGVGAGMGGGGGGAGGPGIGPGARMAVGMGVRVGAHLLRAGARAVGQAGQDERSFHEEVAQKAIAFRQSLLETATLEGKSTADDALVRSQLAFQRQTGMGTEEAIEFRNQYAGATEAGRRKGNITEATARAIMPMAGTWAKRTGMDATTGGKLAGVMSNFVKVASPEAGMAHLGEMQYHLNVGALGTMKELGRPLIGLMSSMLDEDGGRFTDMSEAAATYGAATYAANSSAKAAGQVMRANKLLRRFGDKDAGATLKNIGVTPEMDYNTALRKIAPYITGPQGDQWLRAGGFGQSEERRDVMSQAKLIPVVDAAMKDPKAKAAGARAIQDNQAYLQSIPGRQEVAKTKLYAAEITVGMRSEPYELLKTEARARLIARGELGTTASGVEAKAIEAANLGGVKGEDEQVDREIARHLKERMGTLYGPKTVDAKFAGVENTMGTRRASRSTGDTGLNIDQERRDLFTQASKELEDAAEKQKQAAAMQLQAAGMFMRLVGGGVAGGVAGAIPQGKPAAVPGRP